MAVTWYEVLEPLPVESHRVLFSHGGTVRQVGSFQNAKQNAPAPEMYYSRMYVLGDYVLLDLTFNLQNICERKSSRGGQYGEAIRQILSRKMYALF